LFFPVSMRTAPALVVANGSQYYKVYSNNNGGVYLATSGGLGGGAVSNNAMSLGFTPASNGTAGYAGHIQTNSTSAYVAFNAEL
jgi:hypothetical protein